MDLSVKILGLYFENPLGPAAGPIVEGLENMLFFNNNTCGFNVAKTISVEGAIVPKPCIAGTSNTIYNCELWSELHSDVWINEILPTIHKDKKKPLIISAGYKEEDFRYLIPKLDPFADMFNMGFGRNFRQEGPQQPKIVNILVKINLYESIFGTERNVEFNYNEICKVCDGSGVKEWETCNVCGGSGTCTAQHSPNSRIIMPCNACRGKGKISKVRCGACGGGGIAGVKTKELTINIKPGITPGESMIIHGGGIPDAFGNVGPLIINIEIVFPTTSSFSDEDKVILRKVLNK